MKTLLVFTGFMLWISGRVVSDAVSKEEGHFRKFRIAKRSTPCPWSEPGKKTAGEDSQAKKLLCAFTVQRSSCDLCGQEKITYTFSMKTTNMRIAAFFKNKDPITVYSHVLQGNIKHRINCGIEIKNTTFIRRQPSMVWEVSMKTECEKVPESSVTSPPCSKHNGNLVRQSGSRCSIYCHGDPIFTLPCPDPDKHAETASNTVAVAGGVVGSIAGGVVITVAVGVVCWIWRKRKATNENGEPSGSVTSKVATAPDVVSDVNGIKITETPVSEETSTNEYQELPDYLLSTGISDVPKLGKSTPQTPYGKGEYIDLKNAEHGVGIYSREKACSRPLPVPASETLNKEDNKHTYNRLGAHFDTGGQMFDHSGSDARQDEHIATSDLQSTPEYFVLENSHEDQNKNN